ncbi:MAG: TMEM165/GDT1 family protein [Actinomycetota bacterium]|nr:TMEM165/GDT1 family protein [Actinomycetota bacterium]
MGAILVAFGVIFLAELGDKSQLMALTLAARFRALPVLIGVSVASAVVQGIWVTIGAVLRVSLPAAVVNVAAGAVFLAFAVWTLVDGDEGGAAVERNGRGWAVARVAAAFVLAEMGDKTMLASVALAAHSGALATWIGATLGMVVANGFAVALGRRLGDLAPRRVVHLVASGVFAAFGIVLLIEGLIG